MACVSSSLTCRTEDRLRNIPKPVFVFDTFYCLPWQCGQPGAPAQPLQPAEPQLQPPRRPARTYERTAKNSATATRSRTMRVGRFIVLEE